jgi:hypothetical protein
LLSLLADTRYGGACAGATISSPLVMPLSLLLMRPQ